MFSDVISAYVSLVTNDDGKVQLIQGEGEQQDDDGAPLATPDMATMLPYGFSHVAPVGSDVIAVQVEGRAEQTVIAVQHREHRPKQLSIGEVCLYILQGKILVFLDPADGTLHLGKKGATDFVPLASKVKAELDDIRSKHDTHVHLYNPGPGTPAASAVPTTSMGPAGEVASAVVRCV